VGRGLGALDRAPLAGHRARPVIRGQPEQLDLRGLARIPGRTTVWGVGEVSHSPTSHIWDTLIARYP